MIFIFARFRLICTASIICLLSCLFIAFESASLIAEEDEQQQQFSRHGTGVILGKEDHTTNTLDDLMYQANISSLSDAISPKVITQSDNIPSSTDTHDSPHLQKKKSLYLTFGARRHAASSYPNNRRNFAQMSAFIKKKELSQ